MMNTVTERSQTYFEEIFRLRIALLGRFRVWRDSELIPDHAWKHRKVQSLIKLLALSSSHCMRREELMELLWPEAAKASASNNLRQTLHLARRIFRNEDDSDPGVLIDHNGWLCLTSEGQTWVDVEAFESAAAECRRSKDHTTCQTALFLYTGELLPEDRYEDWIATRRDCLNWLYLSLLIKLGEMFEVNQDIQQAIDIFQKVTMADPTAEHAHRALMRLYAKAGFRQRALHQYHRMRQILDQELALDPDLESRSLYDDILSGRFQKVINK